MKKLSVLLLCALLLACKPPVETALPEPTAASETAVADWPVTEQVAKIPDEIERVDLEDHLFVYLKGGTVYLYASGVSVPLYRTADGFSDRDLKYNFLTEGTALTYCDPNDGTLHIVNLLDPTAPIQAIDPDTVNGVKAFAQSAGNGDVILYLKDEPDGTEALYRYEHGESMRIEESVGEIGEFYLSPDGSSYIFYVYGRPEGSDMPNADCLVVANSEPVWFMDNIEWISEDLRTYLLEDEGQLKLYRHGEGVEILTLECRWFDGYDKETGTFWWEDFDGNYCCWDGTQSRIVLENASAVRNSHTGAYAFFRDGTFLAQYRDGEPLTLCTRDAFVGATSFDADGETLWLAVLNEEKTSMDLYRVTVDQSSVRKELYAKDSDWWSIPLKGERVIRRNRTDRTIGDLYFNDRCIARNAERLYTYLHEPEEPLLFVCGGRLYRFDGETLSAILDPAPPVGDPLDGGAWLFLTADNVLCYYDGECFHRLADGVSNFLFAPFPNDRTTERYAHD